MVGDTARAVGECRDVTKAQPLVRLISTMDRNCACVLVNHDAIYARKVKVGVQEWYVP